MGELLSFPRVNRNITKPVSSTEMKESIEQFRMGYIEDIASFLLNIVMMEMVRGGFDIEEEDENDIYLIEESIKSLMMKKSGFDNPLQEFAEDLEMYLTGEENPDIVVNDDSINKEE